MLKKQNRILFTLLLALNFFIVSAQSSLRQNNELLQKKIEGSDIFNKSFTGFALYSPKTKKILCEYDADKYFTPASNTKIFTLYTALKILGDQFPAFHYIQKQDSLFIWGTGYPGLFNPYVPQNYEMLQFLQKPAQVLSFSTHNFRDSKFGPGWAWDDYSYYFQPEKAAFPIYGNIVSFSWTEDQIKADPPYFQTQLLPSTTPQELSSIERKASKNEFYYNPWIKPFSLREIPFIYSPELFTKLLADTLKKEVQLIAYDQLPNLPKQTYQVPASDSLYRLLMHQSDNYIAEQLLLMCSDKIYGVQNTEQIIDYAKEQLFRNAPDELVWRDGSGLSRYNLFTPRTIIYVLEQLYQLLPQQRLFDIFPHGGQAGTLDKWYAGQQEPYIFAKTGTLSNKHCLSGYIKTDSGQVLLFSFMHNNYLNSPDPLKKEMESILNYIKTQY